MSTMTNLQIVWGTYDNQFKAHQSQPMVARESAAVRAAAASIKSADDLVNNPQVFKYVLKAYGMDDLPYPAMIKKLLVEGTKDPQAYANGFIDVKYKQFVDALGFGEGKDGEFDSYFFVEQLVKKYETVTFEETKGQQDSGVQLALYFQRNAPNATNWYSILADKAMAEVAVTGMGLPKETHYMDVDKLAEMLERRMPIADMKDPAKVKELMQRYAIFSDMQQPVQSPALMMLQNSSLGSRPIVQIDMSLLLAANSLRFN